MRGVTSVLAFTLAIAGCSSTPPETKTDTRDKPREKRDDHAKTEDVKKDDAVKEDPNTYGVKKTEYSIKGGGESKDDGRSVLRKNDNVVQILKERVARDPGDDADKFRLALLCLVDGDLVEAEKHLSSMRARNDKLLPFIEAYLYDKLGDHEKAGKSLQDMMDDWRRSDGFKIAQAVLCAKINGYRRYERQPDEKLAGGTMARIYVEPRNFTLKPNAGRFILHLTYDWELYDDRNQKVPVPWWENCSPEDRFDFINYEGPVTEFYQTFKLKLPENLPLGGYHIKVTVRDATTGKSDAINVPIYVTAK